MDTPHNDSSTPLWTREENKDAFSSLWQPEDTLTTPSELQPEEHKSCPTLTRTCLLILDGLFGVAICTYAWVIHSQHIVVAVGLGLLGAVRMLRSVLLGFKKPVLLLLHMFFWWSAGCTLTYVACLVDVSIQRPSRTMPNVDAYVAPRVLHFLQHHGRFLWILPLVLAVLEIMSCVWIHRVIIWTRDQSEDRSALQDPLLPQGPHAWTNTEADKSYIIRDYGIPSSWSTWLFSKKSHSNNPRDDGSVDFSSVQEDWASKSQEDPYWWCSESSAEQTANSTQPQNHV